MTLAQKLPGTGYTLERMYTNQQHLEVKRPGKTVPEEGAFVFGWDWFIVHERAFEVQIRIAVEPTPQRFEEVRVSMCARFGIADDTPSVGFEEFVRYQAVAMLMPYAREAISSLTSRGFYGPYVVPPVNVMRLMQSQDPENTRGAKQLLEGEKLAFTLTLPAAPESESVTSESAGHDTQVLGGGRKSTSKRVGAKKSSKRSKI